MPITITTITTTAKLLAPLIGILSKGAKAVGARGLLRWDLTNFPKKLAKKLHVIGVVKTIWTPDIETPLLDFYHPSKAFFNGKKQTLWRLDDLGPGNFVIEGIVGQGKTILLRYLAMQKITSNDPKSLPIFIELRSLSSEFNLNQSILAQFANYEIDIDDKSLAYLYKSGHISLFLDGFDELDDKLIKPTIKDLEHLSIKYPELQLVITSRPNHEIQKSVLFNIIKISPLTPLDYSPFLSKLGLESIKIALIKEAIGLSSSKVSGLITTPLMLTLVVMVYESEREIPEALPEFFERLFRVVFSRHDRLKSSFDRKHYSGLSERRLQALFEAFCFMVMQNGFTRSLSEKQFLIAFDQAVEYTIDCQCEADNFRLDLTKVACLMLEEGIDTTTFLHKSIMEYYAAAFITHSSDEFAGIFYSNVLPASKPWMEVLSFLKEIDQYRFARDFTIPEAIEIRVNFLTRLKTRTDETLILQIFALHPDLGIEVSISQDLKENISIISYGPFDLGAQVGFATLENLLFHAMRAWEPLNLTSAEAVEIIHKEQKSTTDVSKYHLSIATLIKTFGSSKIWQAIDIFSERLDLEFDKANRIIKNQQKRKLIFLKPTI